MAIKINEEENKIVPMMRTIAQCYEEILKLDEHTCLLNGLLGVYVLTI